MVFFVEASGALNTSIAIPGGTQAGDVLLLAGQGDESFTCTDSRMTRLYVTTPADAAFFGRVAELWYGIHDGTSAPVTFEATGVGSRSGAIMSAWRSTGVTAHTMTADETTSGPVPQLPQSSRVVLVTFLTNQVTTGFGSAEPTYTQIAGDSDRTPIGNIEIQFHAWEGSERQLSPAATMNFSGGAPTWTMVALRLNPVPTVAPPARLFPRDDDLGVGSGRHFPPPKSQQRSGRRFGYY